MCGITGYVTFNDRPTISREVLAKMVHTLYHRGPDAFGLDIHGGVAMGMRRLSIIDLSGGRQPIYNEDRSIWTVLNGEIYNFPDLRRQLQDRGHTFSTHTDTEVIVHAYEEWGADFPQHFNGMFAIALHDIKNNQFFLVRDHLGIKPLYYSYNSQRIVFGSEIKALLASEDVERELDMDALAEFLAWEYVPGKGTLLKSIRKLEPGEYIKINLDNPLCQPRQFWDIPVHSGEGATRSDNDWVALVDEQLRTSSQQQLISDVPLGAFLSGGVDSSLIAAAMGQAETFSIGFDDPTYNELGWARRVADHLGVTHRDEVIQPNVAELFEHLMHFMEDPIGDFSIFPTYLVARLARRHVTVALSGDGGDELFGGYETYLAQGKALQYQRIPAVLRKGFIEPLVDALRPTTKKKGFVNKAKRFLEGLTHPEELAHARWRIFMGETLRQGLFTEDALQQMVASPAAHIVQLFQQAGDRGHLDRSLYVDVKSYLCDNILTKVDRMSMAVSLEARVPFLDPAVVELAFQVPEALKTTSSQTKVLLKQVAARHVPRECIYRPKEGFSIPIKKWLNSEFRPLLNDLLDPQKIAQDGIFKVETIEQLRREHHSGRANHSHILWSLMVFHDWKKRWMESAVPVSA